MTTKTIGLPPVEYDDRTSTFVARVDLTDNAWPDQHGRVSIHEDGRLHTTAVPIPITPRDARSYAAALLAAADHAEGIT